MLSRIRPSITKYNFRASAGRIRRCVTKLMLRATHSHSLSALRLGSPQALLQVFATGSAVRILPDSTDNIKHQPCGLVFYVIAPDRIRTCVDRSRGVYSPVPLTTQPPTHIYRPRFNLEQYYCIMLPLFSFF